MSPFAVTALETLVAVLRPLEIVFPIALARLLVGAGSRGVRDGTPLVDVTLELLFEPLLRLVEPLLVEPLFPLVEVELPLVVARSVACSSSCRAPGTRGSP
jgi:hypothetical protein